MSETIVNERIPNVTASTQLQVAEEAAAVSSNLVSITSDLNNAISRFQFANPVEAESGTSGQNTIPFARHCCPTNADGNGQTTR
ncbi:hypothetical protein [Sinorhizobium fredii]|uniref:hypothetical protein n=1 Tax=Rhizobium fredii TaxID=380 RepID=UPI0011D28DE3|nr:hypothetical protein [Sinorhizobium fredii]